MDKAKEVSCVGINVAIHKIRVKLVFDLGELVRQTDTVYTKCKLLIYQIYAMQSKKKDTKEHVAEQSS